MKVKKNCFNNHNVFYHRRRFLIYTTHPSVDLILFQQQAKMISYGGVEVSIIFTINLFLSDHTGTLPIFPQKMVFYTLHRVEWANLGMAVTQPTHSAAHNH